MLLECVGAFFLAVQMFGHYKFAMHTKAVYNHSVWPKSLFNFYLVSVQYKLNKTSWVYSRIEYIQNLTEHSKNIRWQPNLRYATTNAVQCTLSILKIWQNVRL